mmetsp:Transcript_56031/g.133489  ORF Transcript_56031/g.133489 Transcript_56031/m.133489 type:complete len:207 (-) Transcript_56031:123-743(-)
MVAASLLRTAVALLCLSFAHSLMLQPVKAVENVLDAYAALLELTCSFFDVLQGSTTSEALLSEPIARSTKEQGTQTSAGEAWLFQEPIIRTEDDFADLRRGLHAQDFFRLTVETSGLKDMQAWAAGPEGAGMGEEDRWWLPLVDDEDHIDTPTGRTARFAPHESPDESSPPSPALSQSDVEEESTRGSEDSYMGFIGDEIEGSDME